MATSKGTAIKTIEVAFSLRFRKLPFITGAEFVVECVLAGSSHCETLLIVLYPPGRASQGSNQFNRQFHSRINKYNRSHQKRWAYFVQYGVERGSDAELCCAAARSGPNQT